MASKKSEKPVEVHITPVTPSKPEKPAIVYKKITVTDPAKIKNVKIFNKGTNPIFANGKNIIPKTYALVSEAQAEILLKRHDIITAEEAQAVPGEAKK